MSDIDAIEALTARWADAYANVRIDEAAGCFARDGVYMVPGKPPVVGHTAIVALHEFWLRNGGPKFSTGQVGSGVGKDHGWHAITWSGIYPTLEPGKTVTVSGKLMHAFTRDAAGNWQIQAGILNVDPPA